MNMSTFLNAYTFVLHMYAICFHLKNDSPCNPCVYKI